MLQGPGKMFATCLFTKSESGCLVLMETTYEYLHKKFGHPNKQVLFQTTLQYDAQLPTKVDGTVCIECSFSKIGVGKPGYIDNILQKEKCQPLIFH